MLNESLKKARIEIGERNHHVTLTTSFIAQCLLFLLVVFTFLNLNDLPIPTVSITHTSLNEPKKYYNHADNNPFLLPANRCSDDQRNTIVQQLGLNENRVNVRGCQNDDWLDLFYAEEADIGSETFVGISIGCNKGDDAVHTARLGLSDSKYDNTVWMTTIGGLKTACPKDNTNEKEIKFPKRGGEMHCIEAMPNNFDLIQKASQELGFDSEEFVVVNAALSARSGRAKFPNVTPGEEKMQLGNCNQSNQSQKRCVDVDMYSLSDYVDKFVKSKGPINSLSIDTEGLDFEVLFGASSVLDRTFYVEFEYHKTGQWGNYHLQDAVRLLDGKGFTCYWASDNYLWRITECYFDVYDSWHGWSNVACVHRSYAHLAIRMENRFLSTLDNWQPGQSHP